MKIAINTRLLIPNKLEGIGWFTYEIFKRITQSHPEHQFYFFFDRKHSEEFIFSKNIEPLELFPQARHPFLYYWWFEFSVARALKKTNADFFISPDGFLSLSTTVKSLNVVHDLSFLHFPELIPFFELQYYKRFFPKFVKKAERILTVSESSKKDIMSKYRIAGNKIDIVYSASKESLKPIVQNIQRETKNIFSRGCDYFVYVGVIQPRKNIASIFLAFEKFKRNNDSDVKLVLVGRKGWSSSEIFHVYNNLSCKNEIILLDYLPQEKLTNVIGSSIGLLYPSLFEGFGVPILEAMNCEVPVITSNVSSMPEVAGDAALLVNPHSVESISNAMTTLYKDETLRQTLIEKGKIQREKFTWDKSASLMWNSIEKVFS